MEDQNRVVLEIKQTEFINGKPGRITCDCVSVTKGEITKESGQLTELTVTGKDKVILFSFKGFITYEQERKNILAALDAWSESLNKKQS